MNKCSVKDCNIEGNFLINHIDNGKERISFCPNHMLIYFLGTIKEDTIEKYPSELPEDTKLHCEICGKEGVQFEEFEDTLELCDKHLGKLIKWLLREQKMQERQRNSRWTRHIKLHNYRV